MSVRHEIAVEHVPLSRELAIRNPAWVESRLTCSCGWVDKAFSCRTHQAMRFHLERASNGRS